MTGNGNYFFNADGLAAASANKYGQHYRRRAMCYSPPVFTFSQKLVRTTAAIPNSTQIK